MLRPVEDKIVVKRESQEQKTTSGLVLAGSNEKSNEAIVVAVGPGIKLNDGSFVEPGVKPGDKVVFNQFNAKEISHEGEDYLIITIRDLLAVIE